MDCRMKVEKPGEIVYELSIKMKADDWEKLRTQLDKSPLLSSYPAYEMRSRIDDLLAQARRIYWPSKNVEEV